MHFKISSRIRLISALAALAIVAGLAGLTLSPEPRVVSAQSGGNVTVTFEKYLVGAGPLMAGTVVCGDGSNGVFDGEILAFNATPGGHIFHIEAKYGFICVDTDYSFTAHVFVTQNNHDPVTPKATLNGVVTEGWMEGAQVHGNFEVLTTTACGPTPNPCIPGTLRIMLGSAH